MPTPMRLDTAADAARAVSQQAEYIAGELIACRRCAHEANVRMHTRRAEVLGDLGYEVQQACAMPYIDTRLP